MNTSEQTPEHLFGPPTPHIGFWYNKVFLGEVRGHPAHLETAATELANRLRTLEHGPDGMAKQAMLAYGARATLYCGLISLPLGRVH